LYFEENRWDNDAVSALLQRLDQGGYGETAAERRVGVIVVFSPGQTFETQSELRRVVSVLGDRMRLGSSAAAEPLLFAIGAAAGGSVETFTGLRCKEQFDFPSGCDGVSSVLSPVGLLPAAFLGLDCIQLLAGAVAMTDHFRSAPAEENVVVQLAVINFLCSRAASIRRRVFNAWNHSLEPLGRWYDHLVKTLPGPRGTGTLSATSVCPRDWCESGTAPSDWFVDSLVHHVLVETPRSDVLPVSAQEDQRSLIADDDGLTAPPVTMPAFLWSKFRRVERQQRHAEIPVTRIVLPHLDTYVLGQFFQFLMISTWVEARLGIPDFVNADDNDGDGSPPD
jgi:glucose-6-phosphate isomerase